MKIPSSCLDCEFYNNCNSAMYMKNCAFFPPEDKPKTIKEYLATLFKWYRYFY